MNELIYQVVKNYIALLAAVRDYIFIAELLIISNWIFHFYVCNKKNKAVKHPLWILIFSGFIGIVAAKYFDEYILKYDLICFRLVEGICYYQMILITKNVGLILGIDLTKYVTLKTKQNKKNEND